MKAGRKQCLLQTLWKPGREARHAHTPNLLVTRSRASEGLPDHATDQDTDSVHLHQAIWRIQRVSGVW
jgi:hypothetical protein